MSSAFTKIGVVVLGGGALVGILQLVPKTPPKPAEHPAPTTVTTAQIAQPVESAKPSSTPTPKIDPNDPAIIDAAVHGDLGKVKELHDKGVSLDGTFGVACRSGNDALVKYLLDNGVDVHENEGSSMPPLLEADGHPEIVKLLLGKGVTEPSLDNAVQASAVNAVTRIIAKGGDPTARTDHASTPLIDAIDEAAKEDASPKALPTLKALLGKGAKVDSDALATAVDVPEKRREPILALLLAAPLTKEATGHTIDHLASQGQGSNDMIRRIATKGVSWSELMKDGGSPPIVSAAFRLDLETVKTLLEVGEPVDQADENGRTAIVAAMQPSVNTGEERIEDMVKLLLAHGANPNRGSGMPGMKPLDVAEDAAYGDVAKLLASHGAKHGRTGP